MTEELCFLSVICLSFQEVWVVVTGEWFQFKMKRGFLTESLLQQYQLFYEVVSTLSLQICKRLTTNSCSKMLCIEDIDVPGSHRGYMTPTNLRHLLFFALFISKG